MSGHTWKGGLCILPPCPWLDFFGFVGGAGVDAEVDAGAEVGEDEADAVV